MARGKLLAGTASVRHTVNGNQYSGHSTESLAGVGGSSFRTGAEFGCHLPHLLLIVLAAAAAPSPCVNNHWLQLEPLLNLQAAPVAGCDGGQSAVELTGILLAVTSGVQGPHTNHVTPAVASLTEVHSNLGQQGECVCSRSLSLSQVGKVARTRTLGAAAIYVAVSLWTYHRHGGYP